MSRVLVSVLAIMVVSGSVLSVMAQEENAAKPKRISAKSALRKQYSDLQDKRQKIMDDEGITDLRSRILDLEELVTRGKSLQMTALGTSSYNKAQQQFVQAMILLDEARAEYAKKRTLVADIESEMTRINEWTYAARFADKMGASEEFLADFSKK